MKSKAADVQLYNITRDPFEQNNLVSLKGQCHEIFELYCFSLIKPIWAPDKQA